MRSPAATARRLAGSVVTIFAAVTLNFLLFRALPGDAVANISHVPGATPELRASLSKQFGLDESLPMQYVRYLQELLHGNLGVSYVNRQSVMENLATALGNTIPMVLTGTVVGIVTGGVIGTIAASRRGTAVDRGLIGSAMFVYALPTQWLSLMLIAAFGSYLPTGGRSDEFLLDPSLTQHLIDVGKHMILPSTAIAIVVTGQYASIVRSALLDAFGEDYVLTARAKGIPNRTIVRRHALRASLLPISNMLALSLGYLVAGSILIETVFSWPGIGRATYDAVTQRDYPMLQGSFLVLTVSIIACNLLADLTHRRLDPRVAR